jgi:hypothetical protein
MECNVTYYHNKWGGLVVKVFACIPKVKVSNLMGSVVCGQQWYVDPIKFLEYVPRLIMWPIYLLRLGF